jgi:hypothetical protein
VCVVDGCVNLAKVLFLHFTTNMELGYQSYPYTVNNTNYYLEACKFVYILNLNLHFDSPLMVLAQRI